MFFHLLKITFWHTLVAESTCNEKLQYLCISLYVNNDAIIVNSRSASKLYGILTQDSF